MADTVGLPELEQCIKTARACVTKKNPMGGARALLDGVRDVVSACCADHPDLAGFHDAMDAACEACDTVMPEEENVQTERRMKPGQTRALNFSGASLDGGLVVAATSAPVENGDILDLDTLNMDRLRSQPRLLWCHETDEAPIGGWDPETLRVEEFETYKRLLFRPVFHDLTERAREASALWEAGVLNTVSIAFMPDYTNGNTMWRADLPKEHPAYGPRGWYFKNARAYEISVVSVPMDAKAVKVGRSRGGAGLDLGALVEEIADGLARRLAPKAEPKVEPPVVEPEPEPKVDDWFV